MPKNKMKTAKVQIQNKRKRKGSEAQKKQHQQQDQDQEEEEEKETLTTFAAYCRWKFAHEELPHEGLLNFKNLRPHATEPRDRWSPIEKEAIDLVDK